MADTTPSFKATPAPAVINLTVANHSDFEAIVNNIVNEALLELSGNTRYTTRDLLVAADTLIKERIRVRFAGVNITVDTTFDREPAVYMCTVNLV